MSSVKCSEKTEAKRLKILKAAEKVFLEKGFHAASMTDIAVAAEMSPPHIYNFYKNKEDLAIAVQESMNDDTFKALETAMAGNRTEISQACLDSIFDAKRSALVLTLMAEASRKPELRAKVLKQGDKFRELVHRFHNVDSADEEHCARIELAMAMYMGISMRQAIQKTDNIELMAKILWETDQFLCKKR